MPFSSSRRVSVSGGGEMIADVFLDHSTYADPPSRSGSLFYNFFNDG